MDLAEHLSMIDAASLAGLSNAADFRPNRKLPVPWRMDSHPSLYVWSDGRGYCDYSRQGETGWSGNAIAFLAMCRGITYREAFNIVSGRASKESWDNEGRQTKAVRQEREKVRDARPEPLAKHQIALIADACKRFGSERSDILKALAKQRDWKEETLYTAALDCLLGYVEFPRWFRPLNPDDGPPWPNAGVLAFVYGWGMKCRWKHKGERQIRWLWNYGLTKPSLWNGPCSQGRVMRIRGSSVYITEGEPDAITLLDCGIKERVCALPSASYVIPGWELQQLAGKTIILAIDNDRAGNLARSRVSEQLKPYCKIQHLQLPDGMDVEEARNAGKLSL